jgi:hypothetical protein
MSTASVDAADSVDVVESHGFEVDAWGNAKKEGYASILDKQLEEAAAKKIQSMQRGKIARQDLKDQKKAACKIQAEYRGRETRKKHPPKPAVPRQTAPRLLIPQTVREVSPEEEDTAAEEVERQIASGEYECAAVRLRHTSNAIPPDSRSR